jgi:hypothetical protein
VLAVHRRRKWRQRSTGFEIPTGEILLLFSIEDALPTIDRIFCDRAVVLGMLGAFEADIHAGDFRAANHNANNASHDAARGESR